MRLNVSSWKRNVERYLIRVPRIIVYQLRFRGPAEKVWVEVGEGIWEEPQ
jgi:hypothetical protein